MSVAEVQIPLPARLLLARAAVQTIADECTADVLHIKGDAVDASLGLARSSGTDVDILVRPGQVATLHERLLQHGWSVYSSFTYGSPFGHAQTYTHALWGYLDLHRLFPGIEADSAVAFERLWADRASMRSAEVVCAVPSPVAQRLILLLNAARTPRPDVVRVLWADAAPADRGAVAGLADVLDARVALAAATGDLDRYRTARTYALWRVITRGGSRAAEWRARIRAARSPRERLAIALRAPLVNVEHLEHVLGRTPTRGEIMRAFVARPVTAAREALARTGRRR